MTHLSRRALLSSTAMIPVALAVDGCAALTAAVAIAPQVAGCGDTVRQKFNLFVVELNMIVPIGVKSKASRSVVVYDGIGVENTTHPLAVYKLNTPLVVQ